MEINELYETIKEQNFKLKRVLGNSAAPGRMIDQTKNILFNRIDDIEVALKYASEAVKQIEVLNLELDDAERELDEKDKLIAELTTKKTTTKKKTAPGVKSEQ